MDAMKTRRAELVLLSIAGVVVFFGVWWLVATRKGINPLILPTPASVIETFAR